MAKILAVSDFGHTGINESLRHQLKHWHENGHEVWQLALGFNGWTPAVPLDEYPWRDRLLPMLVGSDPRSKFGQNCLHDAIKLAKPDIVITSYDVWMISYLMAPQDDPIVRATPGAFEVLDPRNRSFTHIMYFPLDGLVEDRYLPRQMDEWIAGADCPVTYSRYSQEAVLRSTGLHIPMIPIGHDPKVYCPGDKLEARKELKLPEDKFIVSMVATNQYRKRFDEFLKACGKARKYIPNLFVIPWTSWNEQIYGGFDITELVVRFGLEDCSMDPGKMHQAFSEQQMAQFYRAMDVCVLTTIGEGAGLPPLRARACGTPGLVSANTSNIEFVGHTYELLSSHISHSDNNWAAARFSTDVDELAEKLIELYEKPALRKEIGDSGAIHMKNFSLERVLPAWDALLEHVL